MSITHSLNNALSGLSASSRQAEVSSSNLANSLTEGYGVRRLGLSSQSIGGRGAGVMIDGVSRNVDKGVLSERRLADADLAMQTGRANGLAQLESIIGGPDDPNGLAARIVAVEAALTSAVADPSSDIRLQGVARQLGAMTDALNADQDGIQAMRQAADASIAQQINTLNTSLARVERLNFDIQNTRMTGGDPAGLEDQRQLAIDDIAEIVPIRVLERENGRLAVMATKGEMMIDGPAASYEFTPASTIMPHMTLGAATLGGITRDGDPMSISDGFGRLGGGSLEASFTLRDDTLVDAQSTLDAVARDIIGRLQDTGVDLSLSGTTPGILTDGGARFSAANAVGLAGRITLNMTVDPDAGGDLRLIRDGIAGAAGPVGDASQITRFLDAFSAQRTLATGGPAGTSADHAARLAAQLGYDRVDAEDQSTYATARWSALRETELAGGVDSDFEMQMLLRVEQSYAANARVIETVQAMMRALMEI